MYQIASIGRWETLPATAAAICDHDTPKLEALLQGGLDLDVPIQLSEYIKLMPLEIAVFRNDVPMIHFLLEHLSLIHIFPPRLDHDYYTLVTVGLSRHRMGFPEERRDEKLERAELLINLPRDWRLTKADCRDCLLYTSKSWRQIKVFHDVEQLPERGHRNSIGDASDVGAALSKLQAHPMLRNCLLYTSRCV